MINTLHDMVLVGQVVMLGNTRAFDQLVRRHQRSVRSFLRHLTLGNEALSDDLAQETFIRAFEKLSTFRGSANFRTWLFRIAYHLFYDYIRRRKAIEVLDEHTVDLQIQTPPSSTETKCDIHGALATLKPVERTCMALHLIEDLPIKQVAAITGIPEGTIKMHVVQGRKKMAYYLKKNGYDGSRG